MLLERLPFALTLCQTDDFSQVDWLSPLVFACRGMEEYSLVCLTEKVPARTLKRVDGYRALRVAGTMDLSLVGVMRDLSALLAKEQIPIFAVSTFDTDYLLLRQSDMPRAMNALRMGGCDIKEALT